MKCYAIARIDVTDPAWVPDYVATVTGLVEARGGRYLARTPRADRIEGERPLPGIFVIIEWPSRQAAEAFYASGEYQPYLSARLRGASSELVLVAGEDINRVARM